MVEVKDIAKFLADNFELLEKGEYEEFDYMSDHCPYINLEERGNLYYYLLKCGIDIPEKLGKVPRACFTGTRIKAYNTPVNVTSVEEYAFYGCNELTSVTFGNNSKIASIGGYAFNRCHSLTSVTIPSGVTEIWYSAFEDCVSLTTITIPSSVTYISYHVFKDCTNLRNIVYGGTMEEWASIHLNGAWDSGSVIEEIRCTDGVIRV